MNQKNNSASEESEKNKKEIPFVIPVEGSLGLLALGDVGIREWRKVRDESKKNITK